MDKLVNFLSNKDILIYKNQLYKDKPIDVCNDVDYYDFFKEDISIYGNKNQLHAGLATSIALKFNISKKIIKTALKNSNLPIKCLKIFKINNVDIYTCATKNTESLNDVLNERNFYAIFLGMSCFNEELTNIFLKEIVSYNPKYIILFSEIDDSVDNNDYTLQSLGYNGQIKVVHGLDEIIFFITEFSHENAIFIGGFEKNVLFDIQERIDILVKNLN